MTHEQRIPVQPETEAADGVSPVDWSSLYRRGMCVLSVSALAVQMACYSYAPIQSAPPPEARDVGIVVNDRGRTLLGDRVGSLVDRIDGKLLRSDSVNLTLEVHRVTDLRGSASTWTGETVVIPREAILGYRQRKLSKFKTLLVVAVAVAAVIVTATRSLDIFGDGKDDPGGNPPQTS